MIGKRYRFIAANLNSCVGMGNHEGYIVVRARSDQGDLGPKMGKFLIARDYEESFLNFILRIFGSDSWQFPGELTPIMKRMEPNFE